jgi:hypothetical protein
MAMLNNSGAKSFCTPFEIILISGFTDHVEVNHNLCRAQFSAAALSRNPTVEFYVGELRAQIGIL